MLWRPSFQHIFPNSKNSIWLLKFLKITHKGTLNYNFFPFEHSLSLVHNGIYRDLQPWLCVSISCRASWNYRWLNPTDSASSLQQTSSFNPDAIFSSDAKTTQNQIKSNQISSYYAFVMGERPCKQILWFIHKWNFQGLTR